MLAGKKYKVNPDILLAIAVVESGMKANAVNVNKNGTKDYGMFQINEENLKRLGIPVEYAFKPCLASFIAGYILRECINRYGYTGRAIDCYNKGYKARESSNYVIRVKKALEELGYVFRK